MNWTQIHLALNHVSVIGAPFLLLLLGWGFLRGSSEILRLGHAWIILFSALSIALKFTGDNAAEQGRERLAPVQIQVERHEQAADQATTGLFLMGVASVVALVAGRRKPHPPRWGTLLALTVGLLTCVLLARAAHLGGEIGHPELRSDAPTGQCAAGDGRMRLSDIVSPSSGSLVTAQPSPYAPSHADPFQRFRSRGSLARFPNYGGVRRCL